MVSGQQIETVLHDAGVLVGLADGRAIGFGRFELLSIEIKPYEEFRKSA